MPKSLQREPTTGPKMTELSYKYETVQNELSSAMEEWTQLGEKLI